MSYLIDGHNLIPKVAGLSLSAIDDEMQLIELLQEFCRLRRKAAHLYFDGAPPGQPSKRTFGPVTAHFVRKGKTADDAIRARLARLGRSARNWTVVSSDRMVQAAAREVGAAVLTSEAFASLLRQALREERPAPGSQREATLSEEELKAWLEMFDSGEDSEK
jgi:predicted RNA-binding protein with PIN domain